MLPREILECLLKSASLWWTNLEIGAEQAVDVTVLANDQGVGCCNRIGQTTAVGGNDRYL